MGGRRGPPGLTSGPCGSSFTGISLPKALGATYTLVVPHNHDLETVVHLLVELKAGLDDVWELLRRERRDSREILAELTEIARSLQGTPELDVQAKRLTALAARLSQIGSPTSELPTPT